MQPISQELDMRKKSDTEPKVGHGKESASKEWESLTWQDLEAWAGSRSVSRGQAYQRQGRVQDLVQSADNRLLATVIGGDRYVFTVYMEAEKKKDGRIHSKCTCPVGYDGCKHAVAVVAEYLDRLGREKEIPIADSQDPRLQKLEGDGTKAEFDEDESDDELENEEQPSRLKSGRRTRENWDEKIKQHIFMKGREELAELVWSLTQRFTELRDEFRERIALGEGDVDRLIAQARKELQRVTSQEAWRNHWNGEGNLPDYSKLLHRLERLVELGHSDSVARLGGEIIERGMAQVGQSHDEGETAMELAGCLNVVFKAVAKSSLTPAHRLLFAIDAYLQDDYGVIGDAADPVINAKYEPSDWSDVADNLARRLNAGRSNRRKSDGEEEDEDDDNFSRDYQRDQISGWLIKALTKAGRADELLAVHEMEARTTGSYERLVQFLIERKQYDDAQRWAHEGIEKTANKLAGIAANLAEKLCDIARLRKRWDIVAAHAAYQFFDRPGREKFDELKKAADKAGCQESVNRFALTFLETGIAPIRVTTLKKDERKIQADDGWPLPIPEYLSPLLRSEDQRRSSTAPHYDVLIDMAIADKRPDDLLRWYDTLCAQRKQSPYGSSWSGPGAHGDRVAEAVNKSHPQRAIEIYRQQVDQNLAHASVSAYETVAAYLRKMKPILKSMELENDWTQLVDDIRLRHRNRPRFMEILDRLESRTILATQKTRR
jgi:uncharacterized Zn finger protein